MSRVSEWIIGYEPFKIRLPDLKCRTLSVVTAVLLGATGLLLTYFLGDPRWVARFGSLIVLVAVSYGYFGRLTSSHILDWAETSKNTIIDALELQADLDKRGSDSSTPGTCQQVRDTRVENLSSRRRLGWRVDPHLVRRSGDSSLWVDEPLGMPGAGLIENMLAPLDDSVGLAMMNHGRR